MIKSLLFIILLTVQPPQHSERWAGYIQIETTTYANAVVTVPYLYHTKDCANREQTDAWTGLGSTNIVQAGVSASSCMWPFMTRGIYLWVEDWPNLPIVYREKSVGWQPKPGDHLYVLVDELPNKHTYVRFIDYDQDNKQFVTTFKSPFIGNDQVDYVVERGYYNFGTVHFRSVDLFTPTEVLQDGKYVSNVKYDRFYVKSVTNEPIGYG